jgi:hypothetical protein
VAASPSFSKRGLHLESINRVLVFRPPRVQRRDFPFRFREEESDAAMNVWEGEPHFDAAEVGTFSADRSSDAGAQMTGRTDIA